MPPPTVPVQPQVKLVAAEATALAVPTLHRFALGAATVATVFAPPQVAFTAALKVALTVQSALIAPVA